MLGSPLFQSPQIPAETPMAKDKSAQSGPSVTDQEALEFHSRGRPGKLEIIATKPMATQRDLSLAYSPGVAVPVHAIAADPDAAYDYTSKGNLVAVISNGTAILGLGDRGPWPPSRSWKARASSSSASATSTRSTSRSAPRTPTRSSRWSR